MRTVKGPGHLPLAMNLLEKARAEGTKAIVAYNVIIKVSVRLAMLVLVV